MLRTCLFLCGILAAAAGTTTKYPPWVTVRTTPYPGYKPGPGSAMDPGCAINAIAVADELMNSVIFIWQGAANCGTGHEKAMCSVDVSYAIQSVNSMINVILKAVNRCSEGTQLADAGSQCGMAVGEVTSGMAGVAATSSGIALHCKKEKHVHAGVGDGYLSHSQAHCLVDVKSLILVIIRASIEITEASERCTGNPVAGSPAADLCVESVLRITASVAGLGSSIAGVVGHCSQPENQEAACASVILGLLNNLGDVSAAGHKMDMKCGLDGAQRLYLDNLKNKNRQISAIQPQDGTNNNFPMVALAAALPIAAVMSFVAGRRMAHGARQPTQDASLLESEIE